MSKTTYIAASVIAWVLLGACIFWLPYQIPARSEVVSFAALVGFNNAIAIVAVLFGVMVLAVIRISAKEAGRLPAEPNGASGQMRVMPLVWFGLIQTLSTTILFYATAGHRLAAEAQYFVNRIYPLKLGMVPYRDFEFLYGPLLVYVPHWIGRVFSISLYPAYILTILFFQLLGLWLLWAIIRSSRAGLGTKVRSFYLLAFPPLLNISLGLQYTMSRYLIAFAALIAVGQLSRRLRARPILLIPAYAVLTLLIFGLSPETGLVYIPAAITLLVGEAYFSRERTAPAVITFLASLGAVAVLLPANALAGVYAFGKGANAFPVVPALFILFYVVTVFIVGPRILAAGFRFGDAGYKSLPFSPEITAAFLILSLAMVPGALSRADGGHIYFYGLGFFLLFFLAGHASAPGYRVYSLLFGVIFCILVPYTGYWVYSHEVALPVRLYDFAASHPSTVATRVVRWVAGEQRWGGLQRYSSELTREATDWEQAYAQFASTQLATRGRICVPFGDSPTIFVLSRHGVFQPDFFIGFDDVYTKDDVQRKLAGLSRCQLVIAPDVELQSLADPAQNDQAMDLEIAEEVRWFKHLFLYPFEVRADRRRLRVDVRAPLRDYINQHYCIQTRMAGGASLYARCTG